MAIQLKGTHYRRSSLTLGSVRAELQRGDCYREGSVGLYPEGGDSRRGCARSYIREKREHDAKAHGLQLYMRAR